MICKTGKYIEKKTMYYIYKYNLMCGSLRPLLLLAIDMVP